MSGTGRGKSKAATAGGLPQALRDGLWAVILERISEGVLVADRKGVLIAANSSLCRALGYERDELPGRHTSELICRKDDGTAALFRKDRGLTAGENLRCRLMSKDGSYSPATLSTVRIGSGETIGIVHAPPGDEATGVTPFRLASIVANSNDAIVGKDLNGVVTDWNQAAERIFGYTADEMIGQSITRVIPPDRLHEEDRILERMRNGQSVDHFETLRQTKDGKLIDVSVTISPIRNASGTIIGASKIARDITKAKERENEIARMSRLYDALSQINQAIVYTNRHDELCAKVCEVLVERGGFQMAWVGFHEPGSRAPAPVAVYGDEFDYVKRIKDLADDSLTARDPSEISFQTGRPCICQDFLEDRLTKPWRDLIEAVGYRAAAAFPIREQGMIKGTLNVYADRPDFFNEEEISLLKEAAGDVSFALDNFSREIERRNAERVARQEMEFSDTIIESMPGIFCVMDRDGQFLRWNRNLESMSGFPANEIRRMRPDEIFSAGGEVSPPEGIRDYLESSESPVEAGLKTNDGGCIPCIFTTTNVENEASRRLVCMGFDVSKLKEAETALRKLNESLEQQVSVRTRELRDTLDHAIAADGVKSVFLATMSHELRTPLNSIIGFTGILLKGLAGELNPEQLKQLGMIQNSARHLLELINDVLDISKIEAGQLEIHMQSFDLRELLMHAASLVEPMADRKGIELVLDIEPDIGAIVSDKRRIEQLLLNLLNNAIKFTEHGTVRLSAETLGDDQAKQESIGGRAVRLRVSDTGIGIHPEDMGRLFQPFRQLDSGFARQHEGSGLGLAICRRLVDMLRGRIAVESELGAGSTFSVMLPVNGAVAS